jgi:hypothetical protein
VARLAGGRCLYIAHSPLHRQAAHNVLPDARPALARSGKRSIALRENVIWLLRFVSRLRQPFGRTRVHALIVMVRIVAAALFGLYADPDRRSVEWGGVNAGSE